GDQAEDAVFALLGDQRQDDQREQEGVQAVPEDRDPERVARERRVAERDRAGSVAGEEIAASAGVDLESHAGQLNRGSSGVVAAQDARDPIPRATTVG